MVVIGNSSGTAALCAIFEWPGFLQEAQPFAGAHSWTSLIVWSQEECSGFWLHSFHACIFIDWPGFLQEAQPFAGVYSSRRI
jgi:hypothetical protein